MKQYALIGGRRVINIVAAEDESTIGPLATMYDVLDITDLSPAPAIGWERRLDGTWMPPLPVHMQDAWANTEVVEEVAEPAPSSKKKTKSSSDEEPATE